MLRAINKIEVMKQEVAELIEAYGIPNILAAMYAYCEAEHQLFTDCNEAGEGNFSWLAAREAIGDAFDRLSAPPRGH